MDCTVSRSALCLTLILALLPLHAQSQSAYDVRIVDRDAWVIQGVLEPFSFGLLGDTVTVCLWADQSAGAQDSTGGFDFNVCYNNEALTFLSVAPGADLHPAWEFISHQTGDYGDSCAACPNGFVRVYGITNLPDGQNPPAAAFNLDGCIAEIRFQVTWDLLWAGLCPPVGFCSLDCTDNVIASRSGFTLYIPLSGIISGPSYDTAVCRAVDPAGVLPTIAYTSGNVCISSTGGCVCPFQSDHDASGTVNATDLATTIDIIFFGGPDTTDPYCPRSRADFNADGTANAVDLARLIDYVFFGGPAPTDPCAAP